MRGQVGPGFAIALFHCWLVVLMSGAMVADTSAQELLLQEPSFPEWYEDTRLNDVFFLDRRYGFAVGERGLILVTQDGGETWIRKPTSVNCAFHSIHFVDAKHGWIVGGYHIPQYRNSKGVILRTKDGGNTWHELTVHSIPCLRWCQFTTASVGWAVGSSSPNHPSGILMTRDGGGTWSSFKGATPASWRTAYLTDVSGDVQLQLAAFQPQAYRFVKSRLEESIFTSAAEFPIQCIKMLDERTGYAAGSGGRIAVTQNGGVSWDVHRDSKTDPKPNAFNDHPPLVGVPNGPHAGVDLRTIQANEQAVWFAGSPGNYLYRLDLDAKTWSSHSTGTACGINRLHFVNSQVGWAVGDQGTILNTIDGGRSWEVQRGGLASLSLLHFASDSNLSLEFVAKYAIEKHLLCGVCLIGSTLNEDQLRQATARIGVSQVIVGDPGLVEGDRAGLHEFVTRQIRIHRPTIVIVESENNGFAADVLSAVVESGNSNEFNDSFSEPSLSAWTTPIILRVAHGENVESKIAAQQFLTRIGRRLDDHLVISEALLGKLPFNRPACGLTAIRSAGNKTSFADLVVALDSNGIGTVTRRKRSPSRGNLVMMRTSSQKSQTMDQLKNLRQEVLSQNRLQGLNQFLVGLDELTAGVWMHELSQHYIQTGNFELAAEAIAWFARYYPGHPLLYSDLRWLWTYYGSDEIATMQINRLSDEYLRRRTQRAELASGVSTSTAKTVQQIEVHDGQTKMIWKPVEANPKVVNNFEVIDDELIAERRQQILRDRHLQAQRVAIALERMDFNAFDYPDFKFASIRLNEKLGVGMNTPAQWKAMVETTELSVAKAARNEWLLSQMELERERLEATCWNVYHTDKRPVLDGVFDEPFWLSAGQTTLHAEHSNAFVSIAADDEFIYFAIRCEKIPSREYPTSTQVRPRNPNLSASDRVLIQIDVDRDFLTWFQLEIDSRGWVAESCHGNPNWNPTWYVARAESETEWTIEAAMPLQELMPLSNRLSGQAWGIALQRFIDSEFVAGHPTRTAGAAGAQQGHFELLLFNRYESKSSNNVP